MGPRFSVGLYLLATLTFFVDLLDVLLRLYLRRERTLPGEAGRVAATSVPLDIGDFTPYETQLHLRPYAIVVSVHNLDEAGLDRFLEAMAAYRNHLWVIDDASTDDTAQRLERAGVRWVRTDRNLLKPGAIKTLLNALPSSIESIVVVDPDARILNTPGEVEKVLFEFQRSGMAALCPRISIRRDGLLSRFQYLEYCVAFTLGRKALGNATITSGIAVYRRDALQRALEQHSLSVYAEDLENAFLLLLKGESIYYDGRMVVETDGMTRLRQLFSQRVGWNFGFLRVYVEHWRELMNNVERGFTFTYQYVVYMGILTLLLHPLKLVGLAMLTASAANCLDDLAGLQLIADGAITNRIYFMAMYVKYTALIVAVMPLTTPRAHRRYVLPVLPLYVFYGIAQIVPASVGYLNWLALRLWGRRVYRDHYQPIAP